MSARSETYGQWSDRLFVGILESEEITGSTSVDLSSVCQNFQIKENEDWLVRFLNENRDVYGSGAGIFSMYSFSLNPAGREKAAKLRQARLPKTLVERLTDETSQKLINVGNFGIALLALVIAGLALWKSA